MSNNQLAVYTQQTLTVFAPEVLQVMRQSFAPTATDAEFTMFAHRCAVTGLDPFKNQIFFTKYKSDRYGDQVRIMYAEDAYLDKAREKEGFQPPDTQVVRDNDVFKTRRNPETKELEVVEHEFEFPRGKIKGAYSIAYRDGYRPVTAFVEIADLDHLFTGPNKDNWNKWTADMISKLVEQRALKKQYGLNFGDDDEIQQPAGDVPAYEPQRRDITAEAEQMTAQQQQKAEGPPPSPSQATPPADDDAAKIKRARQQMSSYFKELGITGKEEMAAYMQQHARIKGSTPTLAEYTALLKIMEMHLEERKAAAAEQHSDPLDDELARELAGLDD